MNIKNVLLLIACLVVCFAAGAIGSWFTTSQIDSWYSTLNKPSFNPPNWIFGPVWSTLYFMMGVSLYLVLTSKSKLKERRLGLVFFRVQLILNTLWSMVFFGLESPVFALLIIITLWFSIFMTIRYFYRVRKLAAVLLIPYLAWVTFASILNAAIFLLNR